MKRMLAIAVGSAVMFVLLLSLGCGQNGSQKADETTSAAAPANVAKVSLAVDGMTCGGCAAGIKATLTNLDGVMEADVDYDTGKAEVKYDADKASVETIVETINKMGYKARRVS